MISINLDDSNVVENFKALNELRHMGLFSDEELQKCIISKLKRIERRVENDN